jgi:hypothetical protein
MGPAKQDTAKESDSKDETSIDGVNSATVEAGVPLCVESRYRVNRNTSFVSSWTEFQEANHVKQLVRLHLPHGLAAWLVLIFWVWVLVTPWKEMTKGPDESSGSTILLACPHSPSIRSAVLQAFRSFTTRKAAGY